eukprot:TRINITY_DN4283_c0_g1_i1.p1 TRINITY_DN4283_c0_g1~~TRINITY_DN4283_c0_g1_i1.p1  ORF type:complete len:689 (+),score=52.83 TRINITY_DN4283_c0_g1_i1:297-2069(+)
MADLAKNLVGKLRRKSLTPLTEGEIVLSMSFLEQPVWSSHETRVEIWGFLRCSDTENANHLHQQSTTSLLSSDSGEPLRPHQQHQQPGADRSFLVQGLSCVKVKSVAVGGNHAMFISWEGEAFGYGSNSCGQLGTGDFAPRLTAVKVPCIPVEVEEVPRSLRASASKGRRFSSQIWKRHHGFEEKDSQDRVRQSRTIRLDMTEREAHVIAAACGSCHTVLLSRLRSAGTEVGVVAGDDNRMFVCGAPDALGMRVDDNQSKLLMVPEPRGVSAIAAQGNASCCAAPYAGTTPRPSDDSVAPRDPRFIYLWGDVRCLEHPGLFTFPTPMFHVPAAVEDVGLGAFFGLALDSNGKVYAWGDDTYGELGGADATVGSFSCFDDTDENLADLPVPGKVTLPAKVKIVGLSCGEMHSLLLSTDGRVFSFGQNLSGQCGIREAHGTTHLTSGCVMEPTRVPLHGPHQQTFPNAGEQRPYEIGEKVVAGTRHSAVITKGNRVYIWGHPSRHKLGHIGINDDGTHIAEDPPKSRVCVRSPHRDAVRRPRLVCSLLHRRVCALGLGDECTIIVTGEDAAGNRSVSEETVENKICSPRFSL